MVFESKMTYQFKMVMCIIEISEQIILFWPYMINLPNCTMHAVSIFYSETRAKNDDILTLDLSEKHIPVGSRSSGL